MKKLLVLVALALVAMMIGGWHWALAATINGTPNPDTLIGTGSADSIFGFGSADDIRGNGGNDYLVGGSGNDLVTGGNGIDSLEGQQGADTLWIGNATINSSPGGEIVYGGDGNDLIYLNGNGARDTALCGNGTDTVHVDMTDPPRVVLEDLTSCEVVVKHSGGIG